MIWKVVGFRDMLAIASVICALCARGTPSPYVAQATYHAPTGAYHEREAFYITRRKALYHVALSLETNDTFDMAGTREQVEGINDIRIIPAVAEDNHVSCECFRIARNIDDAFCIKS